MLVDNLPTTCTDNISESEQGVRVLEARFTRNVLMPFSDNLFLRAADMFQGPNAQPFTLGDFNEIAREVIDYFSQTRDVSYSRLNDCLQYTITPPLGQERSILGHRAYSREAMRQKGILAFGEELTTAKLDLRKERIDARIAMYLPRPGLITVQTRGNTSELEELEDRLESISPARARYNSSVRLN